MMIFFPQFKVFNCAELACHTLHNVLTLRGAQVRDAAKWSYFLNEAIATYGDQTEVLIAQHHWPRWGHDRCIEFLKEGSTVASAQPVAAGGFGQEIRRIHGWRASSPRQGL